MTYHGSKDTRINNHWGTHPKSDQLRYLSGLPCVILMLSHLAQTRYEGCKFGNKILV